MPKRGNWGKASVVSVLVIYPQAIVETARVEVTAPLPARNAGYISYRKGVSCC